MSSEHDQLIEQINALYERLHSNTLRADDTVKMNEVPLESFAKTIPVPEYVERIYGSIEEFDKAFASFKEPYEIFRAFPEDKIVLDVGAHWGYSVIAMRHQGCKARIYSVEAMKPNGIALDVIKEADGGGYDWFNVAASDEEATLTLYIPMMNGIPVPGLSSTGSTLDHHFAQNFASLADQHKPSKLKGILKGIMKGPKNETKLIINEVPALPLDKLLRSNGNLQNDVVAMKLDIEGHESYALKGAAKLFSQQKPLLMIESANRDPRVNRVMVDYGYFHCERKDGKLYPHLAYSMANDGFWIHPERVVEYRDLGIFEGVVPTAEEILVLPMEDGAARKGPAPRA